MAEFATYVVSPNDLAVHQLPTVSSTSSIKDSAASGASYGICPMGLMTEWSTVGEVAFGSVQTIACLPHNSPAVFLM